MKDLNRLRCIVLALISGCLLQLVDGAAKLVIKPSGEQQLIPAGIGFGLTCEGESETTDLFSDVKWIGPSGELTPGGAGDVEVSSPVNHMAVLMFKAPATDESGMYNCTADYDNIEKLNVAVNLIFYHDITWDDCPEQQALVINSDGNVKCRVTANPSATITWVKDGQPLGDRYVTEQDGIRVTDVKDDDKGVFVVRAMVSKTGRFQTRRIKVEVHVPPVIVDFVDHAEAIEGSEIEVNCRASGFPTPLYSWFDKNHRNLSTVEGHIVDQDTGRMIFSNVKRDDHGPYTCMAKNPAGEAKGQFELSVIVKPEIREFYNVTAVKGDVARFVCHAYGDPPPQMSMRKDGLDRPFSNDDDRIIMKTKVETDKSILTLEISNTIRSDDGLYYCAAENKGAQVEKVGHLTVEFGPVMESTPSTSVKTWNGNPVNLTCIAESIPNATIIWSYLGQEIRNNELYTVYTHSARSHLLVRPPESGGDSLTVYGTYKCEARNVHGVEHINIELQEAHPPSHLLKIDTDQVTATTIKFIFRGPQDDGGMPITAFVVKYYEENGAEDYPVFEWSEGSLYVLKGLKPRTAYKFKFAARNEAGIGSWSDETRIVMPQESAPESPKFITRGVNVSTYPDRFQIHWTEPLDNGRKIDYFELRYFEAEKRENQWKEIGAPVVQQITGWENAPTYEMKSLRANTYYKVEVRAHNNIGFSQDATMVFQTAADPSKRSQGQSPISLPGSTHNGMTGGYQGGSGSGLTTGAIAAIIIVLVLVILVVLDVACYVKYQWGVLFVLRNRVCAKPIVDNKAKEAAVEDAKGGGTEAVANNGNVKGDAKDAATEEKGDNMEKKSRTEVDNPAFDKEKELLKSREETDRANEAEGATEDTPMIQTSGAKDSKPSDNTDNIKNKSPKGSKSSVAKDSLV